MRAKLAAPRHGHEAANKLKTAQQWALPPPNHAYHPASIDSLAVQLLLES